MGSLERILIRALFLLAIAFALAATGCSDRNKWRVQPLLHGDRSFSGRYTCLVGAGDMATQRICGEDFNECFEQCKKMGEAPWWK
jgi:hypothetical protein